MSRRILGLHDAIDATVHGICNPIHRVYVRKNPLAELKRFLNIYTKFEGAWEHLSSPKNGNFRPIQTSDYSPTTLVDKHS